MKSSSLIFYQRDSPRQATASLPLRCPQLVSTRAHHRIPASSIASTVVGRGFLLLTLPLAGIIMYLKRGSPPGSLFHHDYLHMCRLGLRRCYLCCGRIHSGHGLYKQSSSTG